MARREKKPQRCQGHEAEVAGALWEHIAVPADSKRVVSFVGGKRPYAQTLAFVPAAKNRLRQGPVPAIFTDAYAGDESALLAVCGHRYPPQGPGRRPVIRWPQGLAYGQGKKHSQRGRVERSDGRAVSGKARLQPLLSVLG
jgi:hypothetical protein